MPCYALCYLVNSDPTGLTDDEIKEIDEIVRRRKIYDVIPFSDDEPQGQTYFSYYPFFGKPCEVADCIVLFNYSN